MKSLSILLAAVLGGLFLFGTPVLAAKDKNCVEVAVPLEGDDKCIGDTKSEDPNENPIIVYTKTAIKLASGVVGLLAALMLVVAGLSYITAQGNSDQIRQAKSRLTNTVVGLVLFIMMYGILELVLPGSIFG